MDLRALASIFMVVAACALAGGWLRLGGAIGSDLKLTLIGTGFLVSGSVLLGSTAIVAALKGMAGDAPAPAEAADPVLDLDAAEMPAMPAIRRPGFHRRAA